jgi:glucose-1-phosphate cytidylyltransferase
LTTNQVEFHHCATEDWKVTLVDTGFGTQTGGRLLKVQPYVGQNTFLMTYGDGLADVNLHNLLSEHGRHPDAVATVTAVQPLGRFGSMDTDHTGRVAAFVEKPRGDGGWINGGFFVLGAEIFRYIHSDDEPFEREPIARLTRDRRLFAYHHWGFWHAMDTVRDRDLLNQLWTQNQAPWRLERY